MDITKKLGEAVDHGLQLDDHAVVERVTHGIFLGNVLADKFWEIWKPIFGDADAKDAIEELPDEARGPMRVAVESYMEIGRVIREEGFRVREGRATVPKRRRIMVAWKALRKVRA